jgi:hypothetical protein
LTLLFPECKGMVQVKQAAEAARERYAASKALKQQSKRERVFTDPAAGTSDRSNQTRNGEKPPSLSFALASSESPGVPMEVEQHILKALGTLGLSPAKKSRGVSDYDHDNADEWKISATKESGLARQLSRQKQLDDRITAALQKLNEHDEEGRCLPEQLTVDDVGRTMLRRASLEDTHWIAKLLGTGKSEKSLSSLSPVSVLGPPTKAGSNAEDCIGSEASTLALRLWSSSTIILLLCRAIAPYEDPPLGCAVLTLGFSMEKGRLLRIAQIARKPHLPPERFIECLQSFATCMCCSLDTVPVIQPSFKRLRKHDIKEVLSSHFVSMAADVKGSREERSKKSLSRPCEEPLATSPLQSVQEESEGLEESDSCPESLAEKRNAKKDQDKPSKRSRVQ